MFFLLLKFSNGHDGGEAMFGTVDYFMNHFKSCIMNNYILRNSSTLQTNYQWLNTEIKNLNEKTEITATYLRNLEKAYKIINEDLFGWEDEDGI